MTCPYINSCEEEVTTPWFERFCLSDDYDWCFLYQRRVLLHKPAELMRERR